MKKSYRKWSQEELQSLLKAPETYKNNYKLIQKELNTHYIRRTVAEIRHKLYNSNPQKRQPRKTIYRKLNKWTQEETKYLWEGINTFGNNWKSIAVPNRSYEGIKQKGKIVLKCHKWNPKSENAKAEAQNRVMYHYLCAPP